MKYRAKTNILCGGKEYAKDRVYDKKDLLPALDLNDFEEIVGTEKKESKPKSMTTKSLKNKK